MAWKIERWFSEVFPGETEIFSEYSRLPPRELAIVSAAVLDAALAEILVLRLANLEKEATEFLGLNGDGRAPAGSFGSRIQLGVLVRVLLPDDAAILRTIKELRNLFAHRVRVDFLSPTVLKVTTKLHGQLLTRSRALIKSGAMSGSEQQLQEIAHHLPTVAEAGEGLLLAAFTVYHAYFYRLHSRVQRVNVGVASSTGKPTDIVN